MEQADKNQLLLNKFFEYLGLKGYSPRTTENYRTSLRVFLDWLRDEKNIKAITNPSKEIIRDYQTYIYYYTKKDGSKLGCACQCCRLTHIKQFYNFLVKQNYCLYNPALDLELPKVPKYLPKVILTPAEVRSILKQPNTSALLGFRDKMILELFYSTGIRLTELINLTAYDVNIEQNTLRVKGKGNKERIVPLGKMASKYLARYIEGIRPRLLSDKQAPELFLTKSGRKMHRATVALIARIYAKRAGLNKKIGCHTFRHCFATHLLERGADVRYVQELLGHSSLVTTQIYTHIAITRLKKVHHKYHPRELDYQREKTFENISINWRTRRGLTKTLK